MDRYGENYTQIETRYFATRDEGWQFAAELGAEVNMPEHFGDAAFSLDGKTVRLFTYFGK